MSEERAYELPGEEKLGARFAANVDYLMDLHEWNRRQASGYADVSESALRKIKEKPEESNPELKTIENLARAFGAEPYWLLLELDELKRRIAEEGLRPFSDPRPDTTRLNSDLVGSGRSAGARSRDRFGKARGKKAAPVRDGNARFTHTDSDLREVA